MDAWMLLWNILWMTFYRARKFIAYSNSEQIILSSFDLEGAMMKAFEVETFCMCAQLCYNAQQY